MAKKMTSLTSATATFSQCRCCTHEGYSKVRVHNINGTSLIISGHTTYVSFAVYSASPVSHSHAGLPRILVNSDGTYQTEYDEQPLLIDNPCPVPTVAQPVISGPVLIIYHIFEDSAFNVQVIEEELEFSVDCAALSACGNPCLPANKAAVNLQGPRAKKAAKGRK